MATVYKSDSEFDSTSDRSRPSGLAGFNLRDLADEGQEQLNECREQADQLLADARIEAERIRAEASERGYRDGLERAEAEADLRVQAAAEERSRSGLDMIQSAVDQLHAQHQRWMQEYADSLAHTAIAISERIVCRELAYDPQLIVTWVEQAVRSTRRTSKLSVSVHPETLALLGQSLDQMLASPDLPEDTVVEPDASVGHTEVVVRQAGGEIRAGMIAQLRRLEELLA